MKISIHVVLLIGLFLCGCSWKKANIQEGEFDVYTPAPYYGAGFSMNEKSEAKRISLQFRPYDHETLQLHDVMNDSADTGPGGYSLRNEEANIAYKLKRFPVTGTFDYFSKNKLSMWGMGLGLDPYPFIRATVGVNSRFIEAGITGYLNYSQLRYSAKGKWISYTDTFAGDMDDYGTLDCNDCKEMKFNAGVGGFLNIFPIKELALTYAPFIYKPWWDDELGDSEISFEFPYIFSQYLGGSYLIAKHIQVSAGATVYIGKKFSGHYWFFDSSLGFVF